MDFLLVPIQIPKAECV